MSVIYLSQEFIPFHLPPHTVHLAAFCTWNWAVVVEVAPN